MQSRQISGIIALVLVGGLILIGGIAWGKALSPTTATPADTSAEAGFARDMQVHHDQAVELSYIIRELTDDNEVRMLAYDIARSQANQSGQFSGWLSAWGLPQASSAAPMAWMGDEGHAGHGGDEHSAEMPGLVSDADIARLKGLTGVEAEKLFLELMIAHHIGGVQMAEALMPLGEVDFVLSLAESIITAQSSEIGYMQELLEARS